MLEIIDLAIAYPDERKLVEGLNFELKRGEIMALLGHSGAGKSSLLNVVAGFIRRRSERRRASPWQWFDGEEELTYDGSVRLEGEPLDAVPVEERRRVSMVMQGGFVYERFSILKNLALPLGAAGRARDGRLKAEATELLRRVRLFDEVPGEEFERLLRKRAGTLSGGQKQRLALARALAKEPALLLLDEAFANLDPLLREQLFTSFSSLVAGHDRCALVVTHDLADLKQVDRVLLVSHDHERCGHLFYRRTGDGFEPDEGNFTPSAYWRAWDEKIRASA